MAFTSRRLLRGAVILSMAAGAAVSGQSPNRMTADVFEAFEFRTVGPGLTSGRISDIEIDPKNPSVWYVAASAGNLWKTVNRGNTWTPIFDTYGSYSLGAVVVDPKDSNVVWLGTGENNNQRSVSYGDGIYKSTDAGQTWKRMGLEKSEHIQNVVIDPRNSNVVYVTAIGPLWSAGGDRGLYKSIDGGQTWKAILTINEDTGVTDMVMDPKRPDVIYAAAYQRRRAVGQLIGGGPHSGLYKSTDGGQKWTKLTKGLPTVEIGRIGLGINWRNPSTVYALVTAQLGQGGFFRSDDAGATWSRIGRQAPSAGGRGGGRGQGGEPQPPPAPCAPIGAKPTPPTSPQRQGDDLPAEAGSHAPHEGDGLKHPPAEAGSHATLQGDDDSAVQQEGAPQTGGRGGPGDDCYRGGDPGYYNEIVVDGNDPEVIQVLKQPFILLDRDDHCGLATSFVHQVLPHSLSILHRPQLLAERVHKLLDSHPRLLHRVALPDRDGMVLQRFEVDGHA